VPGERFGFTYIRQRRSCKKCRVIQERIKDAK
jgi:hypothetical protein